jgi:hypothetical protein
MKRKRTKKERIEASLREGENIPSVRMLRELYARGMAEVEERRKIDPNYR